MGPNVAGVIGSAVAAGLLLLLFAVSLKWLMFMHQSFFIL
jgi:hypothetical protein